MGRNTRNIMRFNQRLSGYLSLIGDALEKPMTWLDRIIDRLPLSSGAKRSFAEKKYGILGTISFHLLLVVLILLFKISAEQTDKSEGIIFDMKTLEELAQMQFEVARIPETQGENARNIAVDQREDKIESFEDYRNYRVSEQIVDNLVKSNVDQTVKDIIKDNNLNPDDDELPDLATEELKLFRAQEVKEEQVYTGPTNIYFDLEGRKVVYLDVPVYKCEGGGLVKLDIRVNRRGIVEWVSVDNAASETKDP